MRWRADTVLYYTVSHLEVDYYGTEQFCGGGVRTMCKRIAQFRKPQRFYFL